MLQVTPTYYAAWRKMPLSVHTPPNAIFKYDPGSDTTTRRYPFKANGQAQPFTGNFVTKPRRDTVYEKVLVISRTEANKICREWYKTVQQSPD